MDKKTKLEIDVPSKRQLKVLEKMSPEERNGVHIEYFLPFDLTNPMCVAWKAYAIDDTDKQGFGYVDVKSLEEDSEKVTDAVIRLCTREWEQWNTSSLT